jgi:hypothetical protein
MQYGTSFARIVLGYRVVVRVSATKDKLGKLSHKRLPRRITVKVSIIEGVQMTLTLTLALALMFKSKARIC